MKVEDEESHSSITNFFFFLVQLEISVEIMRKMDTIILHQIFYVGSIVNNRVCTKNTLKTPQKEKSKNCIDQLHTT